MTNRHQNDTEIQRFHLLAGTQQPGETVRAMCACNDYLRLFPQRSLRRLLKWYKRQQTYDPYPATLSINTLFVWSARFHWPARAAEYDRRRR